METRIVTQLFPFTPTEFEIIEDRLFGAPDAIAEVLECSVELVESITIHDRTPKQVTLWVPREARPALADALDGSTYLAKSADAVEYGQLPAHRLATLRRAAKTAVAKVRAAGVECGDVPVF
jgi:hypothetical protein